MSAHYEVRDSIAVITLDNGAINALDLATRRDIADGVDKAQGDAGVKAIVLTGAGRAFSGGADIQEFSSNLLRAEPSLWTLIDITEEATKAIVVAMHGICMGGGLELSLGCHYRIAQRDTRIGLPEVKIGLVPGAGGTQRLPRALDVETALNLIVTGEQATAELLARVPGQRLFDRVVDSDVVSAAVAFAAEVADRRPLPLVRERPAQHANPDGYFAFARGALLSPAKGLLAPMRCVDAVEAAVRKPFDEGVRFERELFVALLQTPECQALRHAFFAERAASKIADVPADTPARPIRKVAIIGAGTMGGGIAMNFLDAGLPVTMLETKQETLERGIGVMRKNYEAQVKKGRIKQDALAHRMEQLTGTLRYNDVADADLVIEAVFEDINVKESVFKSLDQNVKPGAVLASNTSTLDLNKIAGFTKRPQDVIGLHFFSPANIMKLLEVVRGDKTAKDVLATAMALAKTIRKTAVLSGVSDGFIGNRMLDQYFRQAGFLLDEGASPQQIDKAMEAFGFAMGPFRVSDLAGGDISWAIRKRRYVEHPERRYSKTADLVCELGRFGQKTGGGWYDYAPGRRDPIVSPVIAVLLDKHRREIGINARALGNDEIVQRLVYALINEGARLLEEGIAARAGDIDVVYLTGYGFPAWRGGPMCFADYRGFTTSYARLSASRATRMMTRPSGNRLPCWRSWLPKVAPSTELLEGLEP